MKEILATCAVTALAGSAYAAPATLYDFGLVSGSSSYSDVLPAGAAAVHWFSVDVNGSESYLDITTSLFNGFDTELGLYDSAGNLLGNDDDNGNGLLSTLSYGTGSGMNIFDSGPATGQDGAVPGAGTYYIALGGFNTSFGATGFNVIGGSSAGDYTVTIYADSRGGPIIPLPSAAGMGLAGLGLVGLKRRR